MYKARDYETGEIVALKVVRLDEDDEVIIISTSRGDGDSVYNHDQTVLRLLNSNSQEKSKTLSSVDHAIKSHFT